MKNFSWKLVLVFVVVVAAIIFVLPSLKPALWPHKQINLGLDLQGGMHLVLEVDTQKALESTVERISQEIRQELRKERIRHVAIDRVEGIKISAQVKKEESREKFKQLLDGDFRDLRELSDRTVAGVQTPDRRIRRPHLQSLWEPPAPAPDVPVRHHQVGGCTARLPR